MPVPGVWPFLSNNLHNNELENTTLIGRVFVNHWETIQRPGGTPALPGNGQTPDTGKMPVPQGIHPEADKSDLFLSSDLPPQGGITHQPRASPWVHGERYIEAL